MCVGRRRSVGHCVGVGVVGVVFLYGLPCCMFGSWEGKTAGCYNDIHCLISYLCFFNAVLCVHEVP